MSWFVDPWKLPVLFDRIQFIWLLYQYYYKISLFEYYYFLGKHNNVTGDWKNISDIPCHKDCSIVIILYVDADTSFIRYSQINDLKNRSRSVLWLNSFKKYHYGYINLKLRWAQIDLIIISGYLRTISVHWLTPVIRDDRLTIVDRYVRQIQNI